jgi:uncharacterized protein (DUF2249 family)
MESNPKKFPWNVTDLRQPGIYEILDVLNNKSYYGETQCLLSRLNSHDRSLKESTHECHKLRQAYLEQKNPEGFHFLVLEYGIQWTKVEKRKKRETEIIELNRHRCYNLDSSVSTKRRYRPFMAKGRRYDDTRTGAIGEGISRTELRRRLIDPTKLDYYYLVDEEGEYGSISFFGQKGDGPSVFFLNYAECISAGYATNRQNAYRKIKRGQKGWHYAHLTASGGPSHAPYKLKSDEIAYKDLLITEKIL